MKKFYVEERADVIIQHIVLAKNKKEAIENAKNWEIEHTEIIDYLWESFELTEVWVYEKTLHWIAKNTTNPAKSTTDEEDRKDSEFWKLQTLSNSLLEIIDADMTRSDLQWAIEARVRTNCKL